jgi:3-oxoacyl-[acyl-carrier-protein] synthase-3
MNVFIRGIDIHLPGRVVTNTELETVVDTSDDWIRARTGIERRYIDRDPCQTTSRIGSLAAGKLLERLGLPPSKIDGIIAGSMFPDKSFPSNACLIQRELGCKNAFAYDLTAACGFIPFAYNAAALHIQAGQASNMLVVGAELCHRIVNWKDRKTCILFGDAAAATLLSATKESGRGMLGSALKSDGSCASLLDLPRPGSANAFIAMDGQGVFKLAVKELAAITLRVLDQVGYTVHDLDLFVPHQANMRLIEAVGKRLGLSDDKVMVNIQNYGNTSSASIPLALYEAEQVGRLKRGDLVALAGIGGGMTWGCNLLRW